MVRAIYDSIYQRLRQDILNGTYPYQSLLPSENTLIKTFSCAHNTVRKALALLTAQGFVQPIHGKGVRVIYQPPQKTLFTLGGIETFKETARRNHLKAQTDVVTFKTIRSDDAIAEQTDFPAGTELYYIERIRRLDGKALIFDKNYFLASIIPGLTTAIVKNSVYEYIEKTLGMRITTSKRTLTVERTTPKDERYLDVEGYDFLAVVSSQTFNSDGIMFEYTQSRHRPDYFAFHSTAIRGK
jgi:GntR family trehalose operon transcriptional repressor